jgi:hypothetical protein
MTPPAATAAGRLRPSASAAPVYIDPVVPPEVEPEVIRNASPDRIRPGRIAGGAGVLRPRERRVSGPARTVPAGRGIAQEVAVLENATAARLTATVIDRVELPSINFGQIFRRRALALPNATSVVDAVRTAPDHPVTNFLVASRVWIGMVAALAAGLVFIQVQLLHTNSGIGTNVQLITQLQRQNADLRTSVSGLSSDQRIVAEAQRMGFVEPPVGSTRFVNFHRGDADRAVSVFSTQVQAGGMTDAGSTQTSSSSDASSSDSSGAATANTDPSQTVDSGQGQAQQSYAGTASQTGTTNAGGSTAAADGGSSPQSG